MQVERGLTEVEKQFESRERALNTFGALYRDYTPNLYAGAGVDGEEIFFAKVEKEVALISDVEYTVIKIEDPTEGIENDN